MSDCRPSASRMPSGSEKAIAGDPDGDGQKEAAELVAMPTGVKADAAATDCSAPATGHVAGTATTARASSHPDAGRPCHADDPAASTSSAIDASTSTHEARTSPTTGAQTDPPHSRQEGHAPG